jgi:GNAT superfamily N-acetyltransferase
MALVTRPVRSRSERADFLDVPFRVFADDPAWIPPLRAFAAERLDPARHPFFDHGEADFWVAYRDGRPVGRISAQIDRLRLARYADATGHFGHLDAVDDPEVFNALLQTAEAWLRARKMRRSLGPYSLTLAEESGMLIEGFATPPYAGMPHSRQHFRRHIEAAGYTGAKDLFAFSLDLERDLVPSRERWRKAEERTAGLRVWHASRARLGEHFRQAIAIYNDAWSENWEFTQFTERETAHFIGSIKLIAPPDYLWFASLGDEPIAVGGAIPNFNEALAGSTGRLFPFGWIPFLWRLKVKKVASARLMLLGVRKRWQGTPLAATAGVALIERLRDCARRRGVRNAEVSWILEDNANILQLIKLYGIKHYKTYRIYERAL